MFNSKQISVIDISGTISTRSTLRAKYNHYEVLSQLTTAAEDKNTVAIILRVNSPGGTAGASWELYSTIRDVNKVKPVYVSISDTCCSGAYLAVCGCKFIYSSLMAMVGSIGVLMQIPNVTELADKIGVTMNTIKSRDFKDIGNPFRPMSEVERSYIEETIEEDHDRFCEIVSRHRKITNPDYVFDGKFFTASTAKELGLIDSISAFPDVVKFVKKIHGAKEVEFVSQPHGFTDKLLSKLSSGLQISLNIPDLFKG